MNVSSIENDILLWIKHVYELYHVQQKMINNVCLYCH